MAKILSDAEWSILRRKLRMYDDHLRHPKPSSNANTHTAPFTYVALPPEDGIPALTESTAPGTAEDDTPGMAECRIYNLNNDGELEAIDNEPIPVFNLTLSTIPQSFRDATTQNWVLVTRSKQGFWYVIPLSDGFDRCNATLKGAITSSGTGSVTTTVDNVVATKGASPVDSPSDELIVDNFFGWDADDNAVCKIEYNYDDDTWELYQVECPA